MSTHLDHALAYAKLGWRIVPLHHINDKGQCTCLRPGCEAPGKHPRIKDWTNQATTDEAIIRAWWARWPDANIGMAMGKGLVDIESEVDCAENLTRLEAKLGPLPDSVSWSSGGGGQHRVFRTSLPIGNLTNIGQEILGIPKTGVDVRGEGGQAVMPPSAHISGGTYRWTNLTPDALDVAELPEAWANYLAEAAKSEVKPGGENPIPEGQRNSTLARLAGTMRRAGMSEPAILAALLETNRERCNPPLGEGEVRAVAASIARYEPDQVMVAAVEGHWEQDQAGEPEESDEQPGGEDPGQLPEHLLHVPGLIDEVMNLTLLSAPYPDRVLAFCGALALQATLCGRKVRDPGGARTNLYLLGLANSGTGKDHPRKINQRIMLEAGLSSQLADSFASGEGIEDRVAASKTVLFQTDEIDAVLLSISKSKDGRAERIMEILLKFYSAAASLYHMRVKAGQEPGTIDQPCLELFGTAIPKHYYESLCDKMLTNGFFARMLVFEAGLRGAGQEPRELPVPASIIEKARYWAALRPGQGNLDNEHPTPIEVPFEPGVSDLFEAIRQQEAAAYDKAQKADDPVAMAIWARAGEKVRRLALVYACSENHQAPVITRAAVEWAWAIVYHQTRQMLFQAGRHVVENEFEGRCKRMLRILQNWRAVHGDRWMDGWKVSRRMKMSTRDLTDVRETLVAQRRIEYSEISTGGRPSRTYRLVPSQREEPTYCPGQEVPGGGLLDHIDPHIADGEESRSSAGMEA